MNRCIQESYTKTEDKLKPRHNEGSRDRQICSLYNEVSFYRDSFPYILL